MNRAMFETDQQATQPAQSGRCWLGSERSPARSENGDHHRFQCRTVPYSKLEPGEPRDQMNFEELRSTPKSDQRISSNTPEKRQGACRIAEVIPQTCFACGKFLFEFSGQGIDQFDLDI
jgi:hypothetical protein